MEPSKGYTTKQELLAALRVQPDDEAWREFLGLYQPMIRVWCLRRGLRPQEAEEVCDRILCKLVDVMRNFVHDPRHRFRSWLRTVVIHAAIDYFRERKKEARTVSLDHPLVRHQIEARPAASSLATDATDLEEALHEAALIAERVRDQVSAQAWDAFWMTTIEKQPARDVAARLGMSVTALYTAKSRVCACLRAQGARNNAAGDEPRPDGAHS
jgi:RNA polymerase sigma-70 factor (ECF subfamily)